MKFLILSEDLRYNKTSAGICNSNFIDALLQNNHQIDVIVDFKENENLLWKNDKNLKYQFLDFQNSFLLTKLIFKIKVFNSLYIKLNGFNFFEQKKINLWCKLLKANLINNKYDLVIFLGAGNSMLNFFSLLKIKINHKILINIHDPYPDSNYPFPYQGSKNIANKIKAKKLSKVLDKATNISFPSLLLFQWMLKYYPEIINKQIIIPHINAKINSLKYFEEFENNKIFINDSCFNLIHGGSLLHHRNPMYLINAFEKFINADSSRKENCFLYIIGRIDKKNILNAQSVFKNVIIVKERLSYKKCKEVFSKAAGLIILEAISTYSPFLPGKFSDYIDAKKNIIALTPKESEIRRLLGKNYPYITEVHNENEILNILENLWKNWNSKNNLEVPIEIQDYVSANNLNNLILSILK